MFKEQELNTYRSITAPQELHDKIMAAKQPKQRWNKYVTGLVAACLILILGTGFLFPGGDMSITVNGERLESSVSYYDISPAFEQRTSDVLTVPVELKLPKESQITVTQGQLSQGEGEMAKDLSASGSVTLLWEIPRGISQCEMYIDDGKAITTLTLEYENSKITITKKGE